MRVTFIKDTKPVRQSGWETYKAGARATLLHGDWLVANGYAYEGWGDLPKKTKGRAWLDVLLATLSFKAGPVQLEED